jgi:hypothetical protein
VKGSLRISSGTETAWLLTRARTRIVQRTEVAAAGEKTVTRFGFTGSARNGDRAVIRDPQIYLTFAFWRGSDLAFRDALISNDALICDEEFRTGLVEDFELYSAELSDIRGDRGTRPGVSVVM